MIINFNSIAGNVFMILVSSALCVSLSACGTSKVAVIYADPSPRIDIGEADNNVAMGPCGFVSGVRKWETTFRFERLAKTYHVNESRPRVVNGTQVIFSSGTLTLTPDGKQLDVRLQNGENGNLPWSLNGLYHVEWFGERDSHPSFAGESKLLGYDPAKR